MIVNCFEADLDIFENLNESSKLEIIYKGDTLFISNDKEKIHEFVVFLSTAEYIESEKFTKPYYSLNFYDEKNKKIGYMRILLNRLSFNKKYYCLSQNIEDKLYQIFHFDYDIYQKLKFKGTGTEDFINKCN